MRILAYGCTSAAGSTTEDFWNGLIEGQDYSSEFSPRICRWKENFVEKSALQKLTSQLLMAWKQVLNSLSPAERDGLYGSQKLSTQPLSTQPLGVIFASTKGCIEDLISADFTSDSDPLTPVLQEFLKSAELDVKNYICVSNACSSTVGALFLAQQWLKQKRVEHVLILAADHIGPFVTQGFFSLRALTQKKSRPFDAQRDGLQLGEAAAAILVSADSGDQKNAHCPKAISIEGIGFDTEGFAVARPSHSGQSLLTACGSALKNRVPDLIVAHGTGTLVNDQVEDQVFAQLFGDKKIPITSTKWSIGHTLGASAAMDLVSACQILKTQRLFSIANTDTIDPLFKGHYLHHSKGSKFKISESERSELKQTRSILVSSLGFGGVHGAVYLKRVWP